MPDPSPRIGILRERPLHASLKHWYAQAGDRFEVPVDGYVIDLVRGDLLIEIQTRGFAPMKRKVTDLLARGHPVRIVHPVPIDTWIVRVDADGSPISRRRSPRHGSPCDVVSGLVSFPDLLARADLEVEVLLIREEEVRRHAPGRAWRTKGWVVAERRLLEVVGSSRIRDGEDLARLLPDDLPESFTSGDLAARLGRPRHVARQLAYCLRESGMISAIGKRGRSIEYRTVVRPDHGRVDRREPG